MSRLFFLFWFILVPAQPAAGTPTLSGVGAAMQAQVEAADTFVIDPLLTEDEIAWLERENAMWRIVRVDDDAKTNLKRLKQSGFSPEEVAQIQERLLSIWDVDVQRNRGNLPDEAMERIKEIDAKFVTRLRAVRLYEVTAIQPGFRLPETMGELHRDWQRSIRRVLDHEEFNEFRLLNSPSALRMTRLLEGVEVNPLELRTICLWQREFERAYGFQRGPTERKRDVGFKEAQIEHGRRIQALLGSARFATFLRREDPAFDRLAQALGPTHATDHPTGLTLWWMHQEHDVALMKASRRISERERLQEELTGKVMALLGPDRYESYRNQADEIWAK